MHKILGELAIAITTLLSCFEASAQVSHFKSYRTADGLAATNVVGSYSWGAWSPNTLDVTIDLDRSVVFVGNESFEIMEKPKKWVIKKDLKYVSMSCSNRNYDKVNIKLYQYDRGEFRIYVMEEKKAKRYSLTYID